MGALAPRDQKMRKTAMTSLSRRCRLCWRAGPSPTSLMPAPLLAGCLWKASPPHVSLQAGLGLCYGRGDRWATAPLSPDFSLFSLSGRKSCSWVPVKKLNWRPVFQDSARLKRLFLKPWPLLAGGRWGFRFFRACIKTLVIKPDGT